MKKTRQYIMICLSLVLVVFCCSAAMAAAQSTAKEEKAVVTPGPDVAEYPQIYEVTVRYMAQKHTVAQEAEILCLDLPVQATTGVDFVGRVADLGKKVVTVDGCQSPSPKTAVLKLGEVIPTRDLKDRVQLKGSVQQGNGKVSPYQYWINLLDGKWVVTAFMVPYQKPDPAPATEPATEG